MPKQEAPLLHLQNYLPPGTYDAVAGYLHQYKVHLTVARERKSILGDYRHSTHHVNHRISVNGNLNTYSFLITLLRELAHLLTFEQFKNEVLAHGREWKIIYSQLLAQFLKNKIFPADIERVLRKYDARESHHRLVEELSTNAIFRTSDGRIFQRGEKLRKRFKCKEVKTGKIYLFSPVYEVEVVSRES